MHDTFYLPTKEDGSRSCCDPHLAGAGAHHAVERSRRFRVICPAAPIARTATRPTRRCSIRSRALSSTRVESRPPQWILEEFCKAFFEVDNVKMRFRPSSSPSLSRPWKWTFSATAPRPGEIRFGEGSDWLEILAAAWCIRTCCAIAGSTRTISGLRLGHGHRPHRHAEIRHAGSARLLRGAMSVARPLRLPPARLPDTGGRAFGLIPLPDCDWRSGTTFSAPQSSIRYPALRFAPAGMTPDKGPVR